MSSQQATQEVFAKEFIHSMQAKGLLPKTSSEASDRKDKAYNQTTPRIFPGPAGKEGMLERLLKDSTGRVGSQEVTPEVALAAGVAAMAAEGHTPRGSHKAMQAQLSLLEHQLADERAARLRMEGEAAALRATLKQHSGK